jgi:glycosyltransferase involved in cell wall biosynthesis
MIDGGFSILTPSLNYGKFLRDAVASVAQQEAETVEHIIADGGSTDDTVEFLRSTPGSVRWISEPDAGQSDGLSKAFRLSKGDWIGWLNADEFYLPGTLGAITRMIKQKPDVDVFYGDFIFVDARGAVLRLLPEHRFNDFVLRYYSNFIPSCGTFIRRSAMPHRLWDKQCRSLMDWDLFLELARGGARFMHIARPFAAFRRHPEQVTARPEAQSAAEFELIRKRHSILTSPLPLLAAAAVGYLGHAGLKLIEGGYRRQLVCSLLMRGADLRWFSYPGARANVRRLLSQIYGLSE